MSEKAVKNYGDSWLYYQGSYEKNIADFLTTSNVINKSEPSFDDIRYEVKRRQVHNCLVKVLDSNFVVLLVGDKELPRSFKVFAAKDVKGGTNDIKIYIDCTNLLTNANGNYELPIRNVDVFIAYLVRCLTNIIYFGDSNKLFNNANIISSTTEAYSKMFYYVIDHLQVGNVDKIKEKTIYLSSLFFQMNIIGRTGESVYTRALNLSLLNKREADVLGMQIEQDEYKNINTFINALSRILKADTVKNKSLTTDAFVVKWAYLFHPSTIFGLEVFPAFANILSDTYVSAYRNNQKIIEKIADRNVDMYTNQLLSLGSELIR